MSVVRTLGFLALALLVVCVGVILGTGVAGAALDPPDLAAPRSSEPQPCSLDVSHEVAFGTDGYELRTVQVAGPACPPNTTVTVAVDGDVIGSGVLDETGLVRIELAHPIAVAAASSLQVSSVS